jgi:hypothetical protein
MDFRSAGALLVGTLSIAALHALIPSHWLAFAVVGRAQRWPMGRTLSIAALAGAGHVLVTMIIGLTLAAAGKAALHVIPEALEHAAPTVVLIALGLYFVLQAFLRPGGHTHAHAHGSTHDHAHDHEAHDHAEPGERPSRAAMGALVLGMTLSPCLDLLPIYVAASALPWTMLLAISLLIAVVTLTIMVGLVWLALRGMERLNLRWLERNESLAVGSILIGLGALLFVMHVMKWS